MKIKANVLHFPYSYISFVCSKKRCFLEGLFIFSTINTMNSNLSFVRFHEYSKHRNKSHIYHYNRKEDPFVKPEPYLWI